MSGWLGPASWWLALLGWSVIVALWHTSAIALAVATWRLWRSRATSRREYVVSVAALVTATTLTLVTPAMLLLSAPPSVAVRSPASRPTLAPRLPSSGSSVPGMEAVIPAARSGAMQAAAPWIGAAWGIGVTLGLMRLCGGWIVAQWIRRRSVSTTSMPLVAAARDAAEASGVAAVPVLASAHVEAPVVIGARAPAVLVPVDFDRRLDPAAMRPLLVHEFAHVRRRDYAANLLQSCADTCLFFSPGARWLSRLAREAREYCCDDVVVAAYGASAYAQALTTLAGFRVSLAARPLINAAGPRLIVRIRRLLQEDVMSPFAGPRLVACGTVLALVAAGGHPVISLSAAGVAQVAQASASMPTGPIPISWITTQAGAAVTLPIVRSTDAGACGTVTIENRADLAVTALRFVGVAHEPRIHPSDAPADAVASTDFIPVAVPASGTATIAVNLLPPAEVRPRFAAGRFQAACAIQAIRYANGVEWASPPAVIFARRYNEISRAFLNRDSSGSVNFCRDERGAEYSLGALIAIALEPGRRARCDRGQWVEQEGPSVPGAPLVWLDIILPGGQRPALKVEPGRMARLTVGATAWGFTPTLDPADERKVRLAVFDLNRGPSARIADLSIGVGDAPVEIPSAGLQLGIRSTRTP